MKKIIILISILIISLVQTYGQVDTCQVDTYKVTLKKVLEVTGTETNFKVVIKQMIDMFKQQNKDIPESLWVEFENEFSKTSIDDLVDMLSPVYQKHITEAELLEIIIFYESPIGTKLVEKTPLIMQESMQVGQEWGAKIGQSFEEKLNERGYR